MQLLFTETLILTLILNETNCPYYTLDREKTNLTTEGKGPCIKLLGCFPRGYFVLLGIRGIFHLVFSTFSSRSYPPVRKRADHCGMNMSTNIALKNRTRCYSFDQYVRKCNDSLVFNMMAKKIIIFPDRVVSTACYCQHPAHRNSKSRVYPLRCQDSLPPTRSYTAAAAGVAVRCCCCCGLGTRMRTRTVPLTSGWRVYKQPRRGHTSRLRSKQALTSTVSQ